MQMALMAADVCYAIDMSSNGRPWGRHLFRCLFEGASIRSRVDATPEPGRRGRCRGNAGGWGLLVRVAGMGKQKVSCARCLTPRTAFSPEPTPKGPRAVRCAWKSPARAIPPVARAGRGDSKDHYLLGQKSCTPFAVLFSRNVQPVRQRVGKRGYSSRKWHRLSREGLVARGHARRCKRQWGSGSPDASFRVRLAIV